MLRDSQVVRRCKARGLKMYLGFYVVDYYNTATPFKDWFDDAGWTNTVAPRVRDFAGAAKRLGFDGLVFDQELYPQTGGKATATWAWSYPGNRRPEQEVRARARERGRQLMTAILEVFPNVELGVYHFQFPGTWEPVVQKVVNKAREDTGAPMLFADFWDGMTSVEGYRVIRFLNAIFYKMPHLGSWETALQYGTNGFFSTLSRRFSNWSYASSRVLLSPFVWIDGNVAGEGQFTAPRPPDYVAAQLAAFKKWGTGGEIANFCYAGLQGFDYTPYVKAMQAAAAPAVVDAAPPRLEITLPASGAARTTGARSIDVEGFAVDNLAVRVVRWKNSRGGAGAARMTWQIDSGDYSKGYRWRMVWSVPGLALHPGDNRITLTVEDIKGLTSNETVTLTRR